MTQQEGKNDLNNNNNINDNNSTYIINKEPGAVDNDLIKFLNKNDLLDLKDELIASKLKLKHFKEIHQSDLNDLCNDLDLTSSQKIRFKHSIKSFQKKNKLNKINIIHQIKSKIVIVGEAAVGKTTLQKSMMGWEFEVGSKSTFAVNSMHKKSQFKCNNFNINIDYEIFDTPGLDRFIDIISLYLRGSLCVIVVYDIINNHSFNKAISWINYIINNVSCYQNIILCANKIDIKGGTKGNDDDDDDDTDIGYDDNDVDNMIKKGRLYAMQHGISFLEISAKNQKNINILLSWINKINKKYLQNNPQIIQNINDKPIQLHNNNNNKSTKKRKCCAFI